MKEITIVRVYEDPGRQPHEFRVLVDRLWPRGFARAAIDYDEWMKDAAPSSELRRWYGHDPTRFTEFAQRYRQELARSPGKEAIARLEEVEAERIVLLTATRDVDNSGAAVLGDVFRSRNR